jgi:mRNA interferase MazF
MKRGDIVLIVVPFTDLTSAKVRPAVIISSDEFNRGEDRVLVAISSKVGDDSPWDVVARPQDTHFGGTGLRYASVFKCGKILTLSANLIERRLGEAGAYMPLIEARIKHALSLK